MHIIISSLGVQPKQLREMFAVNSMVFDEHQASLEIVWGYEHFAFRSVKLREIRADGVTLVGLSPVISGIGAGPEEVLIKISYR